MSTWMDTPVFSKRRGGNLEKIATVLIVLVSATGNTANALSFSSSSSSSSTRYHQAKSITACSSSSTPSTHKALSTSIAIRDALFAAHPEDPNTKCNLETDFYDLSTGLYSEGVWHNCLMGIASLQQQQQQEKPQQEPSIVVDPATKLLATSLNKHAWDGTSFRRRTWSGNWDHSILSRKDSAPYQANYYREFSEHRCIQHAAALLFWSKLAQKDYQTFGGSKSSVPVHVVG